MRKLIFLVATLLCVTTLFATASKKSNGLAKDVLEQLEKYNVTWDSPSTNGSMKSMPLGNGDITSNVWVEQNGDLMLYIGKSDTWSEATRLLKVGRVRLSFSSNPFTEKAQFHQELNLHKGEINISAKENNNKLDIKIWIDANQPVIRVETKSNKSISISCTTELMRPERFVLPSGNHTLASSFRGLLDSPIEVYETADVLMAKPDRIQWYHRNESSFFETILTRQNVSELVDKYTDPYMNRTFGAAIIGTNMAPTSENTLTSTKDGTKFLVSIYPYTAQTESVKEWDWELGNLVNDANKQKLDLTRSSHYKWWDEFWNRSWIFLSGDKEAEKVTRGYLLQRFMMACQSRGAYPAKFNGGNFTFDYNGNNGDFRTWGPGYWYQNCRLYHWPLTGSGDYDLKKPWFNMYMNMLELQTDVTEMYYGHGGAFFPETLNFFGMYIQDDWGWNNKGKASQTRWIRYHYSSTLEMLSEMLDYYDYTKDETFVQEYIVPFATQAIRFYDQHWPRINQQIRFIPANALEQFWDCLNPVDYIAGLQYTIGKLNELPAGSVDKALLDEWNNCLASLPPIPMSADGKKILPAEEYGEARNFENPECYAIFPFKLYGLERPNIDVALNTFKDRIFQETTCWSQDVIQAPLLGLANEAKEYLVKKVSAVESDVAFPAFWRPGSDYIPDFDNGGAMAMGLQHMMLQNVGDKILILPALPESWSVDFKLHAFDNTTVRVKSKGTEVSLIDVYPLSREQDVVYKK